MKQCFVSILLTILALQPASAQTYSDCSRKGPIFYRVEEGPEFKGSLQEYFAKNLQGRLGDFNGVIQIRIMIDSVGNACCMKIQGNNSSLASDTLKDIVNRMPLWTPGRQNHYVITFAAELSLFFTKDGLVVRYINEKALKP